MALIVEDGTGLANSNSYLTEAEFEAYCEDRGHDIPSGNVEAALVRATAWIDARYGTRFAGYRVAADQALALPMGGLIDRGGYAVAADAVPVRVKQATAEAARLARC